MILGKGISTKMHSWGMCHSTDGVCTNASFCTTNKFLESKGLLCRENTNWLRVGLAVIDSEVKACCSFCRSPSDDGKGARRRVWRVVGIGVGLLRYDGEAG